MARKEATPRRCEAVVISSYPDVCRAPDDPCPFQLVGYLSDATCHSDNVNLGGYPATTLTSYLTTVTGDEPGVGGGVNSGVYTGICRPVEDPSSTFVVNGSLVLRHDTVYEMNCADPKGPGNTRGKAVFLVGGPAAGVSEDGEIVGDTDPKPGPDEPEKLSIWGQVGGLFKGAGKAGWETVQFASQASQYITDHMPGAGVVDWVLGDNVPAWLPSAARGKRSEQAILDVSEAVLEHPSLLWEGIKAPYVEAWARGAYGEAIGRGVFELVGGKALGKLGGLAGKLNTADDMADVFAVAKRADAVVPDAFAGVADELVDIGREAGKLDEVVDGARQAGVLDELLDRGKLSIDELDDAGKLTPEEAARAKKGAETGGEDGALIHPTKPFSKADARKLIRESEGRQGPSRNVGHGEDHVAYDGKTPAEVAQSRPGKADNTVWQNTRQAEQTLRDILNDNAKALEALAPGENTGGLVSFLPWKAGLHSKFGGTPYEVWFNRAGWRIGKLESGELHLIHFGPKVK